MVGLWRFSNVKNLTKYLNDYIIGKENSLDLYLIVVILILTLMVLILLENHA